MSPVGHRVSPECHQNVTKMSPIWRRRVGLRSDEKPLSGLTVRLGGPDGHVFNVRAYLGAQRPGCEHLARHLPAMRELVVTWLRTQRDARRLQTPERTLASYVFQDFEGQSREAKLWCCKVHGHRPLNLQHDGVVVALRSVCGEATTAQQTAALVSSVCTAALGYDQPVTAKEM